jgi:hypothetical protein
MKVKYPSGEVPTPEAFSKSDFDLVQIGKRGAKVFVNRGTTPFDKAFFREKITNRQYEAAKAYETRYTGYWAGSKQRNILDITPRGKSVSVGENEAEYALRRKEALEKLETCKGMREVHLKVLTEICVYHEPMGDCRPERRRYRLFCEGTDFIADFLGFR